jgi:hypothetical protein
MHIEDACLARADCGSQSICLQARASLIMTLKMKVEVCLKPSEEQGTP